MVPMRHSSIFKSRWFALLWAAGILWMAYDVASGSAAPVEDGSDNAAALTDATGAPVRNEDVDALAKALDSIPSN